MTILNFNDIIVKIRKNIIIQNILLLFTGTGIAQLIPVIASLFLARIYNEVEYGELSVFVSVVGVISVIANLRYESVIVLSKKESDAKNILWLAIFSSLLIGSITFLALLIFKFSLLQYFKTDYTVIILCCPVAIILTGLYNGFYNWNNRKNFYKRMVTTQLFQGVSTALSRVLFGLIGLSAGLIYGIIFGLTIAVVYFVWQYYLDNLQSVKYCLNISKSKIKQVAWEYRDFAAFSTFSGFFNSISNIGLPIIIASFFSLEVAGVYFFANNLIRLPITLLSQAISQVYKKEAAILYNRREYMRLYSFTQKNQKLILLFITPIILVLSIWGGDIFAILFGETWHASGETIKYFAIFVFFNSLYSPISSITEILRKQREMVYFNVSLALFPILMFFIGKSWNFNYVLLLSSLIGALHFIILDSLVKRYLRRRYIMSK